MRIVYYGLAAAGCLGLLTGCSGVQKDATYANVTELKDAAVKAGMPCPAFEISPDLPKQASCDDETVIAVFSSDGEKMQNWEYQKASHSYGADPLLYGPNWVINAPNYQELQSKLGGVVEDFS